MLMFHFILAQVCTHCSRNSGIGLIYSWDIFGNTDINSLHNFILHNLDRLFTEPLLDFPVCDLWNIVMLTNLYINCGLAFLNYVQVYFFFFFWYIWKSLVVRLHMHTHTVRKPHFLRCIFIQKTRANNSDNEWRL